MLGEPAANLFGQVVSHKGFLIQTTIVKKNKVQQLATISQDLLLSTKFTNRRFYAIYSILYREIQQYYQNLRRLEAAFVALFYEADKEG